MNEVCKNTHAFVNVLCMARSVEVQKWDEEAFRRAYKWANYFEEVHCKLKNKPLLADKLDKYLANFNKSQDIFLGSQQLMFETLKNSKQILKKCLLQNPCLSERQFETVLGLYGIGRIQNDVKDEFLQDLFTLAKMKATLQVFSEIKEKLKVKYNQEILNWPGRKCTEEVVICSVAQLLQRYIYHQLCNSGASQDQVRNALQEKLWIISRQKSGLNVILQLMLLPPEKPVESSVQNTIEPNQLVLHWLLEKIQSQTDSFKQELFSHPPRLLSRVAAVYISFFKVYLGYLIHWGNCMVQELQLLSTDENRIADQTIIMWRHNALDHQGSSYESLVDHFRSLVTVASYTKEICFQALQTLMKTAVDNMQGPCELQHETKLPGTEISCIWTDIHSTLNAT